MVSSEVSSEVNDVCVSCVMAQDGSIYFAPWGATKVLRIKAEGSVDLVSPDISVRLKNHAGGVMGQVAHNPQMAAVHQSLLMCLSLCFKNNVMIMRKTLGLLEVLQPRHPLPS